jgi:N6-L-threonylcarbamoyladenine synthase
MISLIDKADIAASFQEAAFETLIKKTLRAVKEFQARTIIVAGGVAANKTLAKMFKENIKKNKIKVNLIIPPLEFCTDNAAMIGVSAYFNFLQNKKYKLMANSNLNINSK